MIDQQLGDVDKSTFEYGIAKAHHLVDLLIPKTGWNHMETDNQVNISNLPVQGLGLPFIRGDVTFEKTSLGELLSVIRHPDARKHCILS